MANEEPNPFELQPTTPPKQPPWGGMPVIAPQGGAAEEGGSYFALSPQAMQMMWAPPEQQAQVQPLTQVQPLVQPQQPLPPLPPA
jgi:hypothetical protein